MTIEINYFNLALGQFVLLSYDDVTHEITEGIINPFPVDSDDDVIIPGGYAPGSEVYRQDVGTDYWSIRADENYPYGYVLQGSTATACDLVIDAVAIVAAMNGNLGSIDVNASGTGTKRYDIGFGKQASDVFANVQPGPYRLFL